MHVCGETKPALVKGLQDQETRRGRLMKTSDEVVGKDMLECGVLMIIGSHRSGK